MNFQEPVLQHRFRGHAVAVQGAASELGHAVAVRFAAEGAQVVLIDRDEALLQRRAAGLVPSRVLVSGRDPQDAAQADELMAQVHRRFGPLGTWINVFGDEGGTAWPVAGCEAAGCRRLNLGQSRPRPWRHHPGGHRAPSSARRR